MTVDDLGISDRKRSMLREVYGDEDLDLVVGMALEQHEEGMSFDFQDDEQHIF